MVEDIFGIKPYGETAKVFAQGAVDAAAAFFGRICLPASEEAGFLIRERITFWRLKQLINISQETQKLLEQSGVSGKRFVHPKLLFTVMEHGSWADAPEFQKMWAGLLASSCTETGQDESNLVFMNILKQLTTTQAHILNYCCKNARISVFRSGLMQASPMMELFPKLKSLTGISNLTHVDRELDHLRQLELITRGISLQDNYHSMPDEIKVDLTPTSFALCLYVRCQGSLVSPVDYLVSQIERDDRKNKPSS